MEEWVTFPWLGRDSGGEGIPFRYSCLGKSQGGGRPRGHGVASTKLIKLLGTKLEDRKRGFKMPGGLAGAKTEAPLPPPDADPRVPPPPPSSVRRGSP